MTGPLCDSCAVTESVADVKKTRFLSRTLTLEPPPGSLSAMCVDEMLELMVDHWLLT